MTSTVTTSAEQIPPNRDQAIRDLFFYTCVHEYLKLHNLPYFDGSTFLAFEEASISFETDQLLLKHAKKLASSIEPSEHAKDEGQSASVLAICLDESRSLDMNPFIENTP